MSTELDQKIEALTASVKTLASELSDKKSLPSDRLTAIEGELTEQSEQLEVLLNQKQQADLIDKFEALEERVKAFTPPAASAKAAAIMAGAGRPIHDSEGEPISFLKAIADARRGDAVANEYVKAILGTTAASGLAIVPTNFVADIVEIAATGNIYREIMNVVTGLRGASIPIPYEVTGHAAALLQGAYGSNKDVRDASLGVATATLYTIAEIVDIGNQLLRQSEGAAEQWAKRRLGKAFGLKEADLIVNGTGTNQPKGYVAAFLTYGGTSFNTALPGSTPRAAGFGLALSALEARGQNLADLVCVVHPTDFWEAATEGLGTSYAGGWAMDPTNGAVTPRANVWGVPVRRDPALAVGTAYIGAFRNMDLFFGQDYTIDVSSEAGNRFDQNVTGFRAEEEMAFNGDPYVLTGMLQKLTGI